MRTRITPASFGYEIPNPPQRISSRQRFHPRKARISPADRRISLGSYQNKRFDTTPFDTDFLCPLTLRIPGTLSAAFGGDLFYPAHRPPLRTGTGIRSISYARKRKTFMSAAEKSARKGG